MDKVVITGYNGFVGSHLVDLLRGKYEIVGISNTNSQEKDITKITKDVCKITLKDMPNDVFCIVHLAALTDVAYCQGHPVKSFDVNVKGTQNMIEIARKRDSRFIFISSSHVYGIPYKLPLKESYQTNPHSIYASTKLEGEIISRSYSNAYDMDVTILRLFSLYGPKSPIHLVTSMIISHILTKGFIKLGNLHPKRDFIYVDDAVRAIELVIKKGKMFNIYNVGTGKSHSILEICNILKRIAGKNIPIKSSESKFRKLDIDKIVSDSSKIRKIGWKPKFELEEGLRQTFYWFSKRENSYL